jgi:uroporphyrin-III C-methyltransferase/precorrin-2 dehydrogenase/sirohydrochlorin ferrochelatase
VSARSAGLVSLVGAGPGHPDFLTLKALRRLREADLVLYDALVSPEVVALAERADCVDVGKRGGRESTPQAAIEEMLVAAGSRGLRVVRLKGGDPFVFGRGGEEALALQRAGIAFEIVPGVTTAVAAPALAGIPVTHRGTASAFLVVTGSDPVELTRVVDAVSPANVTLVVMMGIGARLAISARLIARGWSATTACAIVLGAATAEAWTWRGSLAALATVAVPATAADLPGTIVIGDVTALPLDLVAGASTAARDGSGELRRDLAGATSGRGGPIGAPA